MSRSSLYPIPSCAECGIESAGRCPACRRHLCIDHFGCPDHQPCATTMITEAHERICYVCGVLVTPEQWSSTSFSHFVDDGKCSSCGRYICDRLHTRLRSERVGLIKDSMRSQRYHIQERYCDACAPVHSVGGIVGAGWLAAGLGVVAAVTFFILQRG
jgi:hypothetical protein